MHKVVVERAPDKNGGPPRLAYVNLEFGLETSIGLRVGGAFVGRDHRRRAGVDAPTGDLGAALNLGVLQGNTAHVALWTGRRVNCRRPHICRSTPAAALARRISIHPACAFGVAQLSRSCRSGTASGRGAAMRQLIGMFRLLICSDQVAHSVRSILGVEVRSALAQIAPSMRSIVGDQGRMRTGRTWRW